jgi:serine/threonine-protein kinase
VAAAPSDRNLLFGILALQMDFITRDALVEAMHGWVLEKVKPLGQILVERGDLAQSRRDLLEPLVDEHVRRHNNDPQQSLAALSSVAPVREALAAVPDPDLHASLAALPAGPPAGTLPPPAGWDNPFGTRFRVLRPHAKGGLGQVYVARDQELGRTVALKEIQLRHADNPSMRTRFVLEAEINGNLEHPGIVPVYGLGSYPDGRPYYAMRFVQGDSLKDAIERFHADSPNLSPTDRALRLRQLLGRFVDVCDAMAYAHSRGVLHRDLKPANVMLGRFGETLVVDWGLAKTLGRTEESSGDGDPTTEGILVPPSGGSRDATVAGQELGTPGFMSPEQAQGLHGRLGPATDVYSLGATLYCLLTGRAPIYGDDFRAKVIRGDIPPPRSVNPAVPRALEAVCLKAMALKPEDRYPSARALAEDVERWLADEPVSARRDPLFTRAWRWARKHRTLTTTAAAVALVTLAALGVGYRREARYSSALAAANTNLNRKNTELSAANATITRANADLAASVVRERERFDLAREAIKSFTDGVREDETLKNPNLAGLRTKLLRRSQEFYRKLEALLKGQTDRDSLTALASAYFDLGKLTDEIGDKTEALASYERARAIRQGLADADPAVTSLQRDLAGSHYSIGNLLRLTGKPAEALAAWEKARSIQQNLADTHPAVTQFQSDLAHSHDNIGNLLSEMGKPAEAMMSLEKARSIGQNLADANPAVTEFQSDLANCHNNIGALLIRTGKPAEALAAYEQARSIRQALADAHPAVADLQSDLGATLNNMAEIDMDAGRWDRAHERLTRAVQAQRVALRAYPRHPTYRSFLGGHFKDLALTCLDLRRPAEAAAAAREYGTLSAGKPAGLYDCACLLSLCAPLAAGAAEAGRYADEAMATLRAAVAAGYADGAKLSRDTDLAPLRGRDDFRRLVLEVMDRAMPADPFRR